MANVLTPDDVQKFNELGYCGPFPAIPREEIHAMRERIERFEKLYPDAAVRQRSRLYQSPHLLFPWLYDLVSRLELTEPCSDLLGPNLLCITTSFRIKEPGTTVFADWHQDKFYSPYEPILAVCMLHLTDQTADHGCLRVIPGSHKGGVLEHEETERNDSLLTRKQRIKTPIDESLAVAIPARAGEIVIFNHAVVHGSPPNLKSERRINLLIDVAPPHTHRPGRRESVIVIRGTDNLGHYDHEARPKDECGPLANKRHEEVTMTRFEKYDAVAAMRSKENTQSA